jgi:hypothetical protein
MNGPHGPLGFLGIMDYIIWARPTLDKIPTKIPNDV